MTRTTRLRQKRSPSKGRLVLFLAGGMMTAVLLVVVLISLEPRSPVQSALPEPSIGTAPRGSTAAPPPPVPSRGESSSATDPETFTFYDTLSQRNRQDPGFTGLTSKPPPRPASPTAAPSSAAGVPSKKQQTRYTVQIAAVKDRPTAEALMNRLKQKGYPAFILPHIVPKRGTWYRVRVGHFTKREAAQETAQRLSGQERLTTYIALE